MKWSYILFVPALIMTFWPLFTLLQRRQPSRAQFLLCITQLMMAFAAAVLAVYFRGRAGSLFIYDYIFRFVTILCPAVYYLGICSLTEPRGATLRQRQAFVPPLVYILGLTVGAFRLGPRRYELLCQLIRDGSATVLPHQPAWNFMLFWDHHFFLVLLIIIGSVLLTMAWRKGKLYAHRFNRFYASDINAPRLQTRPLGIAAWVFLPAALLSMLAVDYRPYYYKYWLIALSLILTVIQFQVGRCIHTLNHDARFLANLIKIKIEK